MFFKKNSVSAYAPPKTKSKMKTWKKLLIIWTAIIVLIGGALLIKTGSIMNKISGGGLISSLVHMVPGVADELKGEKEGRINFLLLGMRGENMPGGGLLADTIMVVSIKPLENKVSFVSIPRDLYVTVPNTNSKQKINAVHYYGEQSGKGNGLKYMKQIAEEISGVPIHYAASINFKGFTQLVDSLGGIEIDLEQPFSEPLQFSEEHVCDSTFTIPTGNFEQKTKKVYYPGTTQVKRLRVVASYPLCTNPNVECGGNFSLPAGKNVLTGEKALCYVRSRKTSSDFERAKRQQIVVQEIKDKALSIGTLTDFEKISDIMDSLGDNARSDMQLWEMKRMYEVYKTMNNYQVLQHVLENSQEGLLYHPETTPETGYILLPIGDNYDKIRELFQNVFSLPSQSDIKPK